MRSSFLILGVLCALVEVRGQHICGFDGHNPDTPILMDPVDEDVGNDVAVGTYTLYDVYNTSAVADGHTKYLSAYRYINGVYQIRTTASTASFVSAERATEVVRKVNVFCHDDSRVQYTFVLPIPDKNNQPPTFSQASYDVTVFIMADKSYQVETDIVAEDSDYEPENAELSFSFDHPGFTPSETRLWEGPYPSSYQYGVNILVAPEIGEREDIYLVNLTASDGVHTSKVPVRITVLISQLPSSPTTSDHPVTTDFTEPSHTTGAWSPSQEPTEPTTTTAPPTTTTARWTPSLEPTEPAPTTTPKTTLPPDTEATLIPSTTLEPPTTTEEPQPCGLVGWDSDKPVQVFDLYPYHLGGVEIWRAQMYNVNSTVALYNPHNKYISAFRNGVQYYFLTGDDYSKFVYEQGSYVITRTVNFNCNGGLTMQYNFEMHIYDGPVEEPTARSVLKADKPFF